MPGRPRDPAHLPGTADRSRCRYARAAHAVNDHKPAPAAPAVAAPPDRLVRITFAHAVDRSIEAVRGLERRGLRHLHASLALRPFLHESRPDISERPDQ